jgi:hypothetical protein
MLGDAQMFGLPLRAGNAPRGPRSGRCIARALGASASLAAMVLASPVVHAACTEDFDVFATIGGFDLPVQSLVPLGLSSSLGSITATMNTVNTAFLSGTNAFVTDQSGKGAWARAIGGSSDISSSATGTVDLSNVDKTKIPPGVTGSGKLNCDTTLKQDFAGVQFGYDAVLGGNVHVGFTAGYLGIFTKDTTAEAIYHNPTLDADFLSLGGSLKSHTEVPFFGLYAAYIKQGFFLDGQLRVDFYQNSLSDPLSGLSNQSVDGRGYSLTINTGQNVPLGSSGWYVEPSAGLAVSRVSFGTIRVPGLNDTPTTCIGCGTVSIDDVTSVLGRATLKIGTSFKSQGNVFLPFFAATVFHEFDGDVTARSVVSGSNNPNIEGLALTMQSTGGIGTYAQFGVGSSVVLGNTGWLGYGRVDYRTGDNIEGWMVNTGIRYQW